MTTRFADFMLGLEEEAHAEGPETVAQLQALRDHFRIGRQVTRRRLEQERKRKTTTRR